jgi:hypothetical protein
MKRAMKFERSARGPHRASFTHVRRYETPLPTAHLLDTVICALLAEVPGTTEGQVMTAQDRAPYRRIDCDGRALVYVRPLRRRGAVRIDVSGLWCVEREASIRIATGTGSATLLLKVREQVEPAVAYVRDAVLRTREAYARERRRRGESHAA